MFSDHDTHQYILKQQQSHYYTLTQKKTHPYDAICTASDDNVLGVPLVSLCEADTQDVWLRPAGSVSAGQQLALHGPQVELRSRTGRNLTLGLQSNKVLTPMCAKVHKEKPKKAKHMQTGYACCQQ